MNDLPVAALALAAGLILLGVATGGWQVRELRRLAARPLVPSDERAYFRSRYRRRLLTGVMMAGIGTMIAGAYLSGLAGEAEQLGRPRPPAEGADPASDAPPEKAPMTPDQRERVRFLLAYWSIVLILVFGLVGLAVVDAFATRRYWLAQYRALRDDHTARLRRDLAVYKQHREQTRGGRGGNRLGGVDTET